MALARSKAACRAGGVDIHATVGGWHTHGQVPYVAHAFLTGGGTICLRQPIAGAAGGANANNHPDQLYWRGFDGGRHQIAIAEVANAIAAAGGVGQITRIEIDCKLMPCDAGPQSCLFAVPAFARNLYGLNNKPLVIFSHADENMGGGGTGHGSSKRVIHCNTGNTQEQLRAAYDNHDGWGWVP
jgi:hypothetical protein